MPSVKELAWAAGFLEGEGDFSLGDHAHIRASQVQREPLDRLQSLFGGHIRPRKHRNGKPTWSDYFLWSLDRQVDVIGVCMTLYTLMSAKRKARIKELVAWWRPRKRITRKTDTHCTKGHEFTPLNTSMFNGSRHCKACCRIRMVNFRERRRNAESNRLT